jgi:hypothetical protein
MNFHSHPSEPANYTGSYPAEYRVIIAGILKEMIIDNNGNVLKCGRCNKPTTVKQVL